MDDTVAGRVFAVTSNTSLAVGLSLSGHGWDVEVVADIEAVRDRAASGDLVLIDLVTTDSGLVAAQEILASVAGVGVLVVGEQAGTSTPVPVLSRPFTLDDLSRALHELLQVEGQPDQVWTAGRQPRRVRRRRRRRRSSPRPEPAGEAVPEAGPPGPDEQPPPRAEVAEAAPEVDSEALPDVESDVESEVPPGSPYVPKRQELRHVLGRARPRQHPDRAPTDLTKRIARVLAAAQELEYLLDDVPALTDEAAVAQALLDEAVAQLAPETVAVWLPASNGEFVAAAHHGLTRAEANLRVPADQPLFNEVLNTGGAALVDPIELAQAAVSGVGGARTRAFMAAAVAIGSISYGVVTVGNEHLSDEDLDVLARLAYDAAPGFALAGLVRRLGHR